MKGLVLAMNRNGAIFSLDHKLGPLQQVTIRCMGADKEVNAQILGHIRDEYEHHVYGLSFLEPIPFDPKLPLIDELQDATSAHLLECNSCQTHEVTFLDFIHMEVFEANRNVSLYCKQCAVSTVWKLAQHEAANDRILRAERPSQPKVAREPRTRNERRHFRVRLKRFRACIRCRGFLDEIVPVKNVSSGGFCFVSARNYDEGMDIDVVIPYTLDIGKIFVPARVTRIRELPGRRKSEYGVALVTPESDFS